jgi:hypothetical protein
MDWMKDNKILTTIIDKFKEVVRDYLAVSETANCRRSIRALPYSGGFYSRERQGVEKLLTKHKHLGKVKSNIQGRFVLVQLRSFKICFKIGCKCRLDMKPALKLSS